MELCSSSKTGTTGLGPHKGSNDSDLIGKLPDDILRTIISLLPTKDGARTQAVARRWRPLWRSAPLNLPVDYTLCNDDAKCWSIVSKILSDHLGPARRFYFDAYLPHYTVDFGDEIEVWFHSRALDNLEEVNFNFGSFRLLPPCVLRRCASTIVVANISSCSLAKEMAGPWPCFPFLKQLTLDFVYISEGVFLGMLSTCRALESLYICIHYDAGCLRISSPSLRSLSVGIDCIFKKELVIEDTPCLERLLLSNPGEKCIIRVIRTPLKILGPLSCCISTVEIESLVFKGMIPDSLSHSICTVKVLVLHYSFACLSVLLDILMCFPCLEKLYIMWNPWWAAGMKSVRQYDPLVPIKCLESHLKILVFKNYEGVEKDVDFAKFFILNAKVLKAIKFLVHRKVDKIWVADQHRRLEVETRASRDAQFEFRICSGFELLNTHDLSTTDPFSIHFGEYGGDVA